MSMTQERRGQIALLLLKMETRRKGVRLSSTTSREIAATAAELKISPDEATEFARLLVDDLYQEAFPSTKPGG